MLTKNKDLKLGDIVRGTSRRGNGCDWNGYNLIYEIIEIPALHLGNILIDMARFKLIKYSVDKDRTSGFVPLVGSTYLYSLDKDASYYEVLYVDTRTELSKFINDIYIELKKE